LDVWERAGVAWFYANDFDKALVRLDTVRSGHALTPVGWTVFGQIYLAKLQARNALQAWNNGFEEFPDHQGFFLHISRAYRMLEDYHSEKALER
jgi:predicted Zn-dependent protease